MNIMRASLLRSSQSITNVNRFTQKLVANQISSGLADGEGLNELASRIARTLGSNRSRAISIARTQTGGAVGSGRHTGMKAAGVDKKGWLTARDKEVRLSHGKAEERYAAGIDLDVPFQLDDGNVMYPGDPGGKASEIINCRCVEIAIKAAGKSFDLAYYSTLQFYSYSDMQKAHAERDKKKE